MEQRLTQAQLKQLIAEVQQLEQRHEAELETEQVREILRELNLPTEFLEEAMVQLRRREALAAQQRQRRLLIAGAVGAIAFLLIAWTLFSHNQQQTLNSVIAQSDRITLAQDDGGNLTKISRQANNQVFYRVTLSNTPVGQKLTLSCKWIDPSGQIVHQNRYETKDITTPTWNTFCRHTISSVSPSGTWKVQAFLGNRLLSDASFNVQ
ncbi:MAG: DUF3859 domain-containing protein [Coleofasciculaceae cyanobacterium]